jgi:hypothetical protein
MVWIIIVAAVVVVLSVALMNRRAANQADLGWVTERWLTEYRADQSADSK